ncbi:putative toxin [Candidatus Termititenax persephonae]|uniref:Toxin n=1 Tax=Candidatus Termititenax persephonae TaxID=2218525 RepID=A0A388TG10_9BACT|nr:putative toxin [Candidatus Termititenax persephonae]
MNGEPLMIEFRLRKGAKGIYLGNKSSLPKEKEFLLARNQKYSVIEKRKERGYNYMVLEVLNE